MDAKHIEAISTAAVIMCKIQRAGVSRDGKIDLGHRQEAWLSYVPLSGLLVNSCPPDHASVDTS